MVNQYYTKGLSLSNPGLVSFFFSLNLDFSLRDVFTTLARTVNFGEENIGKDSYLGSVVTCEWMWPLRAQPALYKQLKIKIWTWHQESKKAQGPDNYNRDLTRPRTGNPDHTLEQAQYNYSLAVPKQIQAQTFPETDPWLHWHRQKLDFLVNLTSGNLFRLFKSKIMINNVRLVVLFKASFLLLVLVNCLEIYFWLVSGCNYAFLLVSSGWYYSEIHARPAVVSEGSMYQQFIFSRGRCCPVCLNRDPFICAKWHAKQTSRAHKIRKRAWTRAK